MIIDKSLVLCDKTTYFGGAGTVLIGDALDMAQQEDLRGFGYPLYLVVMTTTGMTGGTSAQFRLRTGSALTSNDLSANIEDVTLTPVIGRANLTAGKRFFMMLPYGDEIHYRRYMQMAVTRAGTSTAGAINAFLTLEPPLFKALKAAPVKA